MKFTFDVMSAMNLARSLQEALASRHITVDQKESLDVLAQMQEALDWSALATTLSPVAIEAQLDQHERRHRRLTKMPYGPEHRLRTETGFSLRYSLAPARCDYVRIVDPLDHEIAYYSAEEWQKDPDRVMLDILSGLARTPHRTQPEVTASQIHTQLEHPLTIYVRTYCSAEDVPHPQWAKIVLDATLLATLSELEDILRRGKLSEAQRWGDPHWANESNDGLGCAMDPGRLVLSDLNNFRYQARPRHGNYWVETRDVYLDILRKVLAGPRDIRSFDYLRRGDLVIYDDTPHDLLETLLEDEERLEGFATTASEVERG